MEKKINIGYILDTSNAFIYCYADHICHEYMHNVGFFHFEKASKRIKDIDIEEKKRIDYL